MILATADWNWPIDEIATWNRIAACDNAGHQPFWTSNPRPYEDTCVCGAIVRTVNTPESWADHWAEQAADERAYRGAQLRARTEDAQW